MNLLLAWYLSFIIQLHGCDKDGVRVISRGGGRATPESWKWISEHLSSLFLLFYMTDRGGGGKLVMVNHLLGLVWFAFSLEF